MENREVEEYRPKPGPDVPNRSSETYKFREDFTWNGVEVRRYKPEEGGWDGIVRQVLTGWGHETDFHVRYFELSSGGYSSLEKHAHAHVVITLRGNGCAIIGDQKLTLKPYDLLYVKPWEPHQFLNPGETPYGFLCIVNGERDRPQRVSEKELAKIRENTETARIVRVDQPSLVRDDGEM